MTYVDLGATYQRVKDLKGVFAFENFPSFEDLSGFISEELGEKALPFLDRASVVERELSPDQSFWRSNGYLIFENIIPEQIINDYLALRGRANLSSGGWRDNYPFESFAEVRHLCLYAPMMQRLQAALGYRLAMYFNLSRFTSTERGWHMDDYMSAPEVAASGVAIWFALGDIHPDSGPFEFIPGSHRWPTLRRDKVVRYLTKEAYENPNHQFEYWAQLAEYFVNPACANYISQKGIPSKKFLAKKGDVLVWHAGLMHRGSHPEDPTLTRPSIITHYLDPFRNGMSLGRKGKVVEHDNGEWYVSFPDRFRYEIRNGKVLPVFPTEGA